MKSNGFRISSLLGLDDRQALLGHPIVGASFEGFAVENLVRAAPERTIATFYRTGAGAEIDLVLDLPGGERWGIEVKHGLVPKLDRGFHHARADLQPSRAWVVYSGDRRYPHGADVEVVPLRELCQELTALR
jgi:hypothetical protein